MNKSIFVDVFKKRIKEQGFKRQEDFAEAIGIGYSTLKKYLSDKNEVMPDAHILTSICEKLNCDVDYLLGRIPFTTHEVQDVFKTLGLTEASFSYIKSLKDNTIFDGNAKLSTLNQLFTSEEFDTILEYINNARIAHTGFFVKYNKLYLEKYYSDDPVAINKALANNDDYLDSKEYHASKEFGILFDRIIQTPMEDILMLDDYLNYYFEMFGEHFPLQRFSSNEDAAIQIKQCLLTCTPFQIRKDGE